MTLTIELTPEQEARLRAEAKRTGKEPTAVVVEWVETLSAETPAPTEPTWGERKLAELKANGALGAWKDRPEDSLTLAAEFKALAETRGPLPCD